MNTDLVLHYRTDNSYKVFYENGVDMGEIIRMEDGYFAWFPRLHYGALNEGFLLDMYNNLKALNKEYDDTVQVYFNGTT